MLAAEVVCDLVILSIFSIQPAKQVLPEQTLQSTQESETSRKCLPLVLSKVIDATQAMRTW